MMNKIRYQTMLNFDNYKALTRIMKKAGHKSLSVTINQVIENYLKMISEKMQEQEKKDLEIPDQKKPVGRVINELEKKYGIEEYK